MGEIVNLRRVRKARERLADAALAAENRVRHGLSKAERTGAENSKARAEKTLDGHRLDGEKDR
ncbi:DUF4169 family protein [uncultured Rhodoblastus sp.]|uniref:DUF4169 family protein n=1 Tax=uncultured Rhodoblastus sp. TaxID=543037 RepID=UPI0025D7C6D3|nr:DUF4169 family protein [uncultured Rhodoblastus sp.]